MLLLLWPRDQRTELGQADKKKGECQKGQSGDRSSKDCSEVAEGRRIYVQSKG